MLLCQQKDSNIKFLKVLVDNVESMKLFFGGELDTCWTCVQEYRKWSKREKEPEGTKLQHQKI
jgi:hypothetical protein